MTAFLIIGGIGVTLLVLGLLLGDVLDGAFEGLSAGFFSTEALAGFLGALGFGGAIALSITDSTSIALVVGLVAGVILGGVAGWASKWLHNDGGSDSAKTSNMLERRGTVINAIPADGYGTVSLSVAGHVTNLNAKANEPIPVGTTITVVSILSPTSVQVEPLFLP